jgi:hypothetical protein
MPTFQIQILLRREDKKFTSPIIQNVELGKISNTVNIYDRGL